MNTQCTTPNCVTLSATLNHNELSKRPTHANTGDKSAVATLTHWMTAIKTGLVMRYEQQLDRMAFKQMLRLDDHLLKDIGVTRADVVYASQLPLSVNAAQNIEIIAKRNRTGQPNAQ